MKVGIDPPQIEQRVQFHGRLGGAKRRPREHRQAQIDGRGIEGIHGIGQFHAEVLVGVERSRLDDQPLGELEVDTPVAQLVGIGQRRASDRRTDPHVVKLAGLSCQTHFDIAQALAVGQLREGHDAKLLGATEATRPVVAAVSIDDAVKGLPRLFHLRLRPQRQSGCWASPLRRSFPSTTSFHLSRTRCGPSMHRRHPGGAAHHWGRRCCEILCFS